MKRRLIVASTVTFTLFAPAYPFAADPIKINVGGYVQQGKTAPPAPTPQANIPPVNTSPAPVTQPTVGATPRAPTPVSTK